VEEQRLVVDHQVLVDAEALPVRKVDRRVDAEDVITNPQNGTNVEKPSLGKSG